MLNLNSSVSELNKVGKALTNRLKKLGIETIQDLIFYYPFRYDDFSQMMSVDKLEPDMVATVKVKVEELKNKTTYRRRKTITEAVVSDETGQIRVIWFNQPWISKNITIDQEIFLSGKVSGDLLDVYFNSPSYEKVTLGPTHTGGLIPIYSLTSGITHKQLRFLIKSALPAIAQLDEFLPEKIKKQEKLIDFKSALKQIHFPENEEKLALAKKRLAFNELFLIQLGSQLIKKKLSRLKAQPVKFFNQETKNFISTLDFELTLDQKKVAWEILKDMGRSQPMNRLLEGDVGSGKTLVAAIAFYNTALGRQQAIFMAPTEILARQHFDTLRKLFENVKSDDINIGLLTRSQKIINNKSVSKKDFLEGCKNGSIDIIVGTHAIIQKDVGFMNLSLVVVDEQHRFGVKQRQALKKKGNKVPHFLSLTATPIPRTLALTLYGDLDLSIIKEMPQGRKKIITRVAPPDKRQLAYNFIAGQIKAGRQVFVICPLIDPSDKLGVRSVTQEFKKLNEDIFPDLKIGLLHGRLKADEKERAIGDFSDNKTNILVSTSVIEVGVDVPNATVMMIEGAERFGLAQLHQFRGRVGRSNYQSYCFLFSDSLDSQTNLRLQSLVNCHDGFVLANKDLEFRGSGSVYGSRQSGFANLNLKMADLRQVGMVKKIKKIAEDFIQGDSLNDYPLLQEKVDALGFIDHLE